jgi:hypothetical protein
VLLTLWLAVQVSAGHRHAAAAGARGAGRHPPGRRDGAVRLVLWANHAIRRPDSLVADFDHIQFAQAPGLSKRTVSPSRALSRARASGEIQLMRPSCALASSMPTIW